jgi:hypothetical protein
VFQRPPCAPAEPRRPATARSARPHAHIGRRCPPDRSTAPLWCFPRRRRDPPPPLVPLDRSSDSGLRDCAFAFLTAILAVPSRDFHEVVHWPTGPCSVFVGLTGRARVWCDTSCVGFGAYIGRVLFPVHTLLVKKVLLSRINFKMLTNSEQNFTCTSRQSKFTHKF